MRLMMQGLTDAAFEQRFGAEDACLAALAAARQAAGWACPTRPRGYLHKRLRHAMTERGARHVLGAAPWHRSRPIPGITTGRCQLGRGNRHCQLGRGNRHR
jgi:hypothetical protein